MPVSVTNSRLIYDALKECDVKIMSALPETWLVHLIRMADEDPDMTLVRLAKEEEGIGISGDVGEGVCRDVAAGDVEVGGRGGHSKALLKY